MLDDIMNAFKINLEDSDEQDNEDNNENDEDSEDTEELAIVLVLPPDSPGPLTVV